jgi:hypothetical protein
MVEEQTVSPVLDPVPPLSADASGATAKQVAATAAHSATSSFRPRRIPGAPFSA